MADDKTKKGAGDRNRVAANEGYEVSYFARKHGLARADAAELIKRVGSDRKKLNEAAATFRKG
ncbi:MAG: hypothetical protein JWL66_2623 [Sphingomonadales bacterium]|nr:hypothetical protein [Sphingomonadales bacterium]